MIELRREQIIVLSEADLELSAVKAAMLENECNGLMIPSKWFKVDELPKLGTGKADFSKSRVLAMELIK